ncbi:MAG: LysM peptidoglycan-binding domain-containing protein [Verrucomicrobia bacterium]|nr:LysM peptidoglycan-binding domain-containing protein [Verrucomicrobiota bacterium]
MNNPNPLIPQGSLLEQQAKSKPHLRIALFIVAVHVVFLGLLLMQGCKREAEPLEMVGTSTNESPFGTPDPSSLFTSNLVSDFELATPGEPVVPERDTEGGFGERTPDLQGATSMTNLPAASTPPPPIRPPSTTTPPLVTREHSVAPRDTFYDIGKQYGVTAAAIAKANPNADPNRLRIGQKLIIPPPAAVAPAAEETLPAGVALYEVKSRDTLTRIARTHGTTATAIRQVNGMTTDRIYVGQKLKLPPKTDATTTAVNP